MTDVLLSWIAAVTRMNVVGEDSVRQIFVGKTECSVIMLQYAPKYGRFESNNSDSHVFGRLLLREKMRPL